MRYERRVISLEKETIEPALVLRHQLIHTDRRLSNHLLEHKRVEDDEHIECRGQPAKLLIVGSTRHSLIIFTTKFDFPIEIKVERHGYRRNRWT